MKKKVTKNMEATAATVENRKCPDSQSLKAARSLDSERSIGEGRPRFVRSISPRLATRYDPDAEAREEKNSPSSPSRTCEARDPGSSKIPPPRLEAVLARFLPRPSLFPPPPPLSLVLRPLRLPHDPYIRSHRRLLVSPSRSRG